MDALGHPECHSREFALNAVHLTGIHPGQTAHVSHVLSREGNCLWKTTKEKEMGKEGNGTYETTSIDLAAYLLTSGAHLVEVSGSLPESTFHFEKVSPEVISAYWSGEAKVSPQQILQAYKHSQPQDKRSHDKGGKMIESIENKEVFEFGQKVQKPRWLVNNLIPIGHLVFCHAQSHTGKSFFGEGLAVAVVYGQKFLGQQTMEGDVLIIDQDTGSNTLGRRLVKFGNAYGGNPKHKLYWKSQAGLSLADGSLVETIGHYPTVVFVLLDSLHSVIGNLNPDSTKDMNRVGELYEVMTGDRVIMINHHISEKRGMSVDQMMTCLPHSLPMGNSAINQRADTYYILASPDYGGKLETLYIRPVSKRTTIPGKPRILRLLETGSSLIFRSNGFYVEPDSECETDILILFKEHPEPRKVGEVYDAMGHKHGINKVRESLRILRNKCKLIEETRKPRGLFSYHLPEELPEQLPLHDVTLDITEEEYNNAEPPDCYMKPGCPCTDEKEWAEYGCQCWAEPPEAFRKDKVGAAK